jgi:hypothetical protein
MHAKIHTNGSHKRWQKRLHYIDPGVGVALEFAKIPGAGEGSRLSGKITRVPPISDFIAFLFKCVLKFAWGGGGHIFSLPSRCVHLCLTKARKTVKLRKTTSKMHGKTHTKRLAKTPS